MPNANPSDADLTTITRFSRAMEFVLVAVLIMLPVSLGLYAFVFSAHLASDPSLSGLNVTAEPLSFLWSLAAFVVLLLASSPLLYATNAARLMFGGFRKGEVFTSKAAARIKQIALGLLAQAFVAPLGGIALSAVLSGAGKADGLVLSISSNQLWIALFALIFLGIARVMRAAAPLAEDHAAIV